MKLAIILGAGASYSAGLPLLKDVFKDFDVRTYLETDAPELFRFLDREIWQPRELTLGQSEKGPTIEEVLTYLKLSQPTNPELPIDRLWRTNSPLKKLDYGAVRRQLLGCVYYAVYANKGKSENRDLNSLVLWADKNFSQIDWFTYNWDAKLEQAFYYETKFHRIEGGMPTCPGSIIGWNGSNPRHTLTKLHGSITWFRNSDNGIAYKSFGKTKGRREVEDSWISYLHGSTENEPVIAEPNYLKHDSIARDQFLISQWQRMRSVMIDVDALVVVGYSLPDGDVLAKQLLFFISSERRWLKRNPLKYVVVDPYGGNGVFDRFQKILGKQAAEAAPHKLSECWDHLNTALGIE